MREKRFYRNQAKKHLGRRTLRTEPLEKRELLAADFTSAALAIGSAGNDGVCQADSALVDTSTCAPQASGDAYQLQGFDGSSSGGQTGGLLDISTLTNLSDAEKEGLTTLREEEKLARDVYLNFTQQWGEAIFTNIAASESKHMEAVGSLIVKYGLEDPVGDNAPREFTNPDFTSLYNDLVAAGSVSLVEAYKVGAMIEEMDIVDLQHVLAETTHEDIQGVYENLMQGSRNHLRAFAAQIEAADETYVAQFLSQAEFDAIADSPMETGDGQSEQGQGAQAQNGSGDENIPIHQRLGTINGPSATNLQYRFNASGQTLEQQQLQSQTGDAGGECLFDDAIQTQTMIQSRISNTVQPRQVMLRAGAEPNKEPTQLQVQLQLDDGQDETPLQNQLQDGTSVTGDPIQQQLHLGGNQGSSETLGSPIQNQVMEQNQSFLVNTSFENDLASATDLALESLIAEDIDPPLTRTRTGTLTPDVNEDAAHQRPREVSSW